MLFEAIYSRLRDAGVLVLTDALSSPTDPAAVRRICLVTVEILYCPV